MVPKDLYPHFFTTYIMEDDKFNGKPHYTSADGRFALSYASDCDYWLLQGCGQNCENCKGS